ncbi:MAG: hypothetical protein ACXWB1_02995 [Kaistella sp.]
MKKISLMLFAAAALAVSCTNTKNAESQTKVSTEATPTATQENAPTNTTAQNTTEVTTATPGNRPALNPAHGEPYHRCDIQVGAPLDSPAPAQAATPQVVPQQAPAGNSFNTNPISPSASAAPSVSSSSSLGPKPALNPAHGEPHHRCDLQVGAPLT